MGDASEQGFGNALIIDIIDYSEYGQWSSEITSRHSNFKKLLNLVIVVKRAYEQYVLKDAEQFNLMPKEQTIKEK
eukprot:scaffold1833_cov263-Chaetoceros_neogracile.AAC.17